MKTRNSPETPIRFTMSATEPPLLPSSCCSTLTRSIGLVTITCRGAGRAPFARSCERDLTATDYTGGYLREASQSTRKDG